MEYAKSGEEDPSCLRRETISSKRAGMKDNAWCAQNRSEKTRFKQQRRSQIDLYNHLDGHVEEEEKLGLSRKQVLSVIKFGHVPCVGQLPERLLCGIQQHHVVVPGLRSPKPLKATILVVQNCRSRLGIQAKNWLGMFHHALRDNFECRHNDSAPS